MSISHTTFRSMLSGAAAAAAFLGLTAAATSAEMPMDDIYDWSASLISVDQATGTAVFQARIEAYAHIGGLDSYKDGDRLTLVWTGKSWAAGVRDLGMHPQVEADALELPVEFVSTARDDTYLNFRIAVPQDAMKKLMDMGTGARVTVYSPRKGATWGHSVVKLHQYNDLSDS